jgi:tRNA A37 threonylcarbamoyladenosine dehydratase
MADPFERTERLFGAEAMCRLKAARVAVFGIGGVGGHCAEALGRSGVGAIDFYDNDVVSITNINRQVVALHSTLGRFKAEVMAERIRDINPDCEVRAFKLFYMPDTAGEVDLSVYDYVADAIDTVTGKIELIIRAKAAGVPVICAMGAGNKLDPASFAVTDISRTETDPLARVLRKELRARGIEGVKVVYSKEPPKKTTRETEGRGPASNAFVPPVCGLIMAGEIVKDLITECGMMPAED